MFEDAKFYFFCGLEPWLIWLENPDDNDVHVSIFIKLGSDWSECTTQCTCTHTHTHSIGNSKANHPQLRTAYKTRTMIAKGCFLLLHLGGRFVSALGVEVMSSFLLQGDETLTLSTFLPHDDELRAKLDWSSQWPGFAVATAPIRTQICILTNCWSLCVAKVGRLHCNYEFRVSIPDLKYLAIWPGYILFWSVLSFRIIKRFLALLVSSTWRTANILRADSAQVDGFFSEKCSRSCAKVMLPFLMFGRLVQYIRMCYILDLWRTSSIWSSGDLWQAIAVFLEEC